MFRKENSSCTTTKSSNNNNNYNGGKQNSKKGGGNKKSVSFAATPTTTTPKTTSSTLDVPLRKSDIRHLKQRVKDFFLTGNNGSVRESTNDQQAVAASAEDEASNAGIAATQPQQEPQEQQQQKEREEFLSKVLDKVFVQGNVCSRQLNHAELGKLTLYVRTPNIDELQPPTESNNSNNNSQQEQSLSSIAEQFVWPYAAPQVIWIVQPPKPNTNQVEVALPTVALLSVLLPESMPTVYIPSAASSFLCRGAHLMRAGMLNLPLPFATSAEKEKVSSPAALLAKQHQQQQQVPRVIAISIVGNPQPMAVGLLEDGVQSTADIGVGAKGVGATVWTCYGDDLWQQQVKELDVAKSQFVLVSNTKNNLVVMNPMGGASYNDGQYGNVGFLKGERVARIVSSSSSSSSSSEDEDEEEEGVEQDENQAVEGGTAWDASEGENAEIATTSNSPESASAEIQAPSTNEADEALEVNAIPVDSAVVSTAENSSANEEEEATEEEPISQEELLHQSVCKALLTSLSPKDLPITVANFYANHVLPNRPPGTTIQIKQTKYKKFGNYLQEQVERKLLTLGPGPNKNNKDKTGYLMSFDKRHADLLDYKQEHSQEVQEAKDSKNAAAESAKSKLVLVNLYVVPHHFVSLLRLDPDAVKATQASSPERAGTGLLTLPEARSLLESYLERENLADLDQVQLDGPLFDTLYKKKKGQDDAEQVDNNLLTVSRKDLSDTWTAAMSPGYAIVQMPGNKVQKLGKGEPPKVQIEVSMRQSRKFITKVRGMEAYGVNGTVLAKDVGRRLATQATVETESEKGAALPKGCVELVLGGNFADELEALLLGDEKLCPNHGGIKNSDYRLPKGSIDVVLRKGVPGRKKTKKVKK